MRPSGGLGHTDGHSEIAEGGFTESARHVTARRVHQRESSIRGTLGWFHSRCCHGADLELHHSPLERRLDFSSQLWVLVLQLCHLQVDEHTLPCTGVSYKHCLPHALLWASCVSVGLGFWCILGGVVLCVRMHALVM